MPASPAVCEAGETPHCTTCASTVPPPPVALASAARAPAPRVRLGGEEARAEKRAGATAAEPEGMHGERGAARVRLGEAAAAPPLMARRATVMEKPAPQ